MSFAVRLAQAASVTCIVLMTGCASVTKAPAAADAAAKEFKANPAAAQIYVYRNEMFGAAISMPVTLDGKLVGSTGPKSYFKFDVPAGNHVITSQDKESAITVTTELGKLYYVWQEVKMGAFSAGSQLQLVPAEVGQKGVLESSLIQSQP